MEEGEGRVKTVVERREEKDINVSDVGELDGWKREGGVQNKGRVGRGARTTQKHTQSLMNPHIRKIPAMLAKPSKMLHAKKVIQIWSTCFRRMQLT